MADIKRAYMNIDCLVSALAGRVNIKFYAEYAMLLEFDHVSIADIHQLAKAFSNQAQHLGIVDIVPAYCSLMLVCQNTSQRLMLQEQLLLSVCHSKPRLQNSKQSQREHSARIIEIPVCYDPYLGPDLERLANTKSMTIEELITLHAEPKYLVCMLGFVPGFMYLSGLNQALSAPRLQQPRTHIAAGSVAIGGNQTGIYPFDMPGGWQIIGRTPLQLNNLTTMEFGIAKPMDRIKFLPISLAEYNRTNQYD